MPNKTITYSSEMMTNFKQLEVMSAEGKFEALQTDEGHSLFFSLGTDNIFYLTQETPGHTTGWQKTDLSSSLKADYGGAAIIARNFAVAQNRSTQKADLAVVITANGNDNLYLSLGNSTSDAGWTGQLNWVSFPFDDPNHSLSAVSVFNVFISEASDGEYIVVDVLRDPHSASSVIFRYYLDPNKTGGQAWHPHDVAADIDASKVSSCLGRRQHDRVDGLYTLGSVGGDTQLIYQMLYNPFNRKEPPDVVRLMLPDDSAPSALASVAVSGNFTDLYVACEKALYYFPHDQQKDSAQGIKVLDNAIFEEVSSLFAFATDTKIIIWGLNRAQQIFYTTCDQTQIQTPASWSYPLPIVENVEQVSPYVNRADNGNTFFVHIGASLLQKAVQTPATTLWRFDNILLPPLDKKAKAANFNSYTTRLHVTDDKKRPIANAEISLGAVHRASVYINNRYYLLEPTPITVNTDAIGGVTIVERIENLQGTCLQVHGDDGSIISINPMDKPFQKVAALNSKGLSDATITNPDGTRQKLVDPTTSDDDKQNVADTLSNLKTVYDSLPTDGTVKPTTDGTVKRALSLSDVPRENIMTFAVTDGAMALSFDPVGDLGNALSVGAGDLYNYMKSGTDYVIHIVKDAAEDAWHFVATIAGQAYHFVLDAATKVLGALEFVFNAIKTAIEFLIKFLLFLFDWDDFLRTKDAYKSLLKFYFDQSMSELPSLKTDFNRALTDAATLVTDWAGVKGDGWKSGVDNSRDSLGNSGASADLEKFFSAPAMSYFTHFLENVSNVGGSDDDGSDENVDQIMQSLTNQSNSMVGAITQIQSQLLDGSTYSSLSLEDLLKQVTAIVVDDMLQMSQGFIDPMLDLLTTGTESAWDELDEDVWIPVLSDILEFFHIHLSFSMLDVILMVGAIPATLAYKLEHDTAPFSSDRLDELRAALHPAASASRTFALFVDSDDAPPTKTASPFLQRIGVTVSPELQAFIFRDGYMLAGVVAILTGAMITADAMSSKGNKQFAKEAAISTVVASIGSGLTAMFATPCALKNPVMKEIAAASSSLAMLGKILFTIKGWVSGENKKVAAGFDAVLAVIAMTATCYHFYELSNLPESNDRKEANIVEAANMCNYFRRIAGFGAQISEDPDTKAALGVTMGVLGITWGSLQIAAAAQE